MTQLLLQTFRRIILNRTLLYKHPSLQCLLALIQMWFPPCVHNRVCLIRQSVWSVGVRVCVRHVLVVLIVSVVILLRQEQGLYHHQVTWLMQAIGTKMLLQLVVLHQLLLSNTRILRRSLWLNKYSRRYSWFSNLRLTITGELWCQIHKYLPVTAETIPTAPVYAVDSNNSHQQSQSMHLSIQLYPQLIMFKPRLHKPIRHASNANANVFAHLVASGAMSVCSALLSKQGSSTQTVVLSWWIAMEIQLNRRR